MGKKASPTSFSPVTSANRNYPKNFLTFSLNLLCHTVVKFQGHTLCQSQIIEFEPRFEPPLKKICFLVKSCKIEVMITSLTEMLELPNFGHRTTFTI